MQFRVLIPENVRAGQTIRIHCPDDTEANVKVPSGLKAGDSFIFELTADQLTDPQSLMKELQKKNESDNDNNNYNNSKNSRKKKTNGPGKTSAKPDASSQTKRGFLDREISNMQDFFLALGVGLIIGVGIVVGFILGVLSVTSHLDGIDIGMNITKKVPPKIETIDNPANGIFGRSQAIPQSTNNPMLKTTGFSHNVKLKATTNSPPNYEL